jgi:type I restriction enzyme S subunit
MTGTWQQTTLGDLADAGKLLIQTGPFGSQLHKHDYCAVGVPVVPTEAIGHRRLRTDGIPQISAEKAHELKRHCLRAGDILFARRGVQATGYSAIVESQHDGWLCGTGAILLRLHTPDIDPIYLSFYLASDESIAWLKQHAVGAVMPNINDGVLRSFPVELPPLCEQQRVADVLGSLDDKIELNRRMNQTLETMGRALFKSWFIDFDPVYSKAATRREHPKWTNAQVSRAALPNLASDIAELFPDHFDDSSDGPIPAGWNVGTNADLFDIKKTTVKPNEHPTEIFHHYSIPAYDQGTRPTVEFGDQIMSNKFLVSSDCVLLTKLNPRIRRVWLPFPNGNCRSICSTEFLVLKPRPSIAREFIYSHVSSDPFFGVYQTMVTGTSGSHQRIKPEYLVGMQAVLPPLHIVDAYGKIAAGLFEQSESLQIQSFELARTRDSLLPKLLSGELSLPEGHP